MRVLLSFAFLLLLTLASAYFAREYLREWGEKEISLLEDEVVQYPRGTSLQSLSEELEQRGIVSSAGLFQIWVRLFSGYANFQAGQYRFSGSLSPKLVAEKIRSGDVYRPVVLEVTIPEGFQLSKIVQRYVAAGVGTEAEFNSLIRDDAFLKSLKIDGPSLEGFFYPATYRYYEPPDAREVLRRGVEVFFEKLPADYEAALEPLGLSLYEAVTFASLIELETKHDDERAKVSEVIWRRYKDGAALAIDATIIYGIEDYKGNLSHSHLRDRSNPYNTRVHPGLPPTPIGSPARASLLAVLSPSDEGYYYYVVDASQGDRHHFSKTLREHNRWVAKYVRAHRNALRQERKRKREEQQLERRERRRKSAQ